MVSCWGLNQAPPSQFPAQFLCLTPSSICPVLLRLDGRAYNPTPLGNSPSPNEKISRTKTGEILDKPVGAGYKRRVVGRGGIPHLPTSVAGHNVRLLNDKDNECARSDDHRSSSFAYSHSHVFPQRIIFWGVPDGFPQLHVNARASIQFPFVPILISGNEGFVHINEINPGKLVNS